MSLYGFESESIYVINGCIKKINSEEMLRGLPPKTMCRFMIVVLPRRRIVGQCKSAMSWMLKSGNSRPGLS